jgi:uncharacterized repeat protein (TIGR03803 family)
MKTVITYQPNSSRSYFVRIATGAILGTILLAAPVHGATLETIASLTQEIPAPPQVRLSNGVYFGVSYGGFNGASDHGSIFRLGPTGAYSEPFQFSAATQEEANPTLLIAGSDGNMYGATSPRAVGDLNGIIFRYTSTGTFTELHRFQDGKGTHATSLVLASDGNLYGTAAGDSSGGFFNHPPEMHNSGVFFKLTLQGVFTTLYTFTGSIDGSLPNSLIQGADGNFYGSTQYGPESPLNVYSGLGTVFKITPAGAITTLYRFAGGIDGGNPSKIIQGGDGNLYGITTYGVFKTVFKITPAGIRNTVYHFEGDNGSESAGLIASSDGNVYGTTKDAGIPQAGSIFCINPAGEIKSYYFDGSGTGSQPGLLFEGLEHSLYGATTDGGQFGHGTVFRLNQAPPRDLLNISTRSRVLNGNDVMIGGFIITGTDPKQVLIRGIGPSLSAVIGTTLQDTVLELHQGSTILTANDDWRDTQQAAIQATGIPPTNNLESAILTTLSPGAYTAVLFGKNNSTGVGVVEVYDLDQGVDSKLGNISTRALVDVGNNVMIGGLIVSGGASGGGNARVLVRAIGPSLTAAGIQGALQDPTLELHDSNGATLASNDNWKVRSDGTNQQGEIEATDIPPGNDLESALVKNLAPGNYTVVVRGKNNGTGVAVVEAYTLE